MRRILPGQPGTGHSPLDWGILSGQAFHRLGEYRSSRVSLPGLFGNAAALHEADLHRIDELRDAGRRDTAMALLEARPVSTNPIVTVARTTIRLELLVEAWRMTEARREHDEAVAEAPTAEILSYLIPLTARIHGEGAEDAFRRMLGRIPSLPASDPWQRQLLEARLRLGMGDRTGFLVTAKPLLEEGGGSWLAPQLHSACAGLGAWGPAGMRRDRVFVLGLSRTGTSSLHQALRTLGYASAHWTDPITGRMLSAADADLYDALSDIPCADAVEELADRYPTARFIYSERPMESWLHSVERHYRRFHNAPDLDALRRLMRSHDAVPEGPAWRRIHESLYTRHLNFVAAYEAHETRILSFFEDRPGRMLRFNVFAGDGWDKLCGFLRRDRPEEEFPHYNAG